MRALFALAGAALLRGCGYNGVIDRDEAVKAAWSEVENQYQRRADLVPNLVATVRGAANFEERTLTEVIEARARATSVRMDPSIVDDPERMRRFEAAQGQLGNALGRLLVVSEQYPQLQSSAAFRDLMVQLEGTENRIAVARGRYNTAVAAYNAYVQRFPTSIGSRMRGRSVRPTFAAPTPGAERAPQVQFP
jgi:LemA protein